MKKLLIIMLLTLLFPLAVNAEPPHWYPTTEFEVDGDIQQININERSIIVSDIKMILGSRVKVHSLNEEFYPSSKLKIGMFVGLSIIERKGEVAKVVEIWLLQSPDSSDTPTPQTISDQQLKKQDRVSSKVRK